jgi:hypothetical protein
VHPGRTLQALRRRRSPCPYLHSFKLPPPNGVIWPELLLKLENYIMIHPHGKASIMPGPFLHKTVAYKKPVCAQNKNRAKYRIALNNDVMKENAGTYFTESEGNISEMSIFL